MSDELRTLFRYDLWANAKAFEAAARVPPDARGEGVTRSAFELLSHLVGTEEGYLNLVRGTLEATLEEWRAFFRSLDGDLARLRARSRDVSGAYLEYLEKADEAELARRFAIPWLEIEVSAREALVQVAVHSIEHRADLSTVLTRHGAEAPNLDLVFWIAEGRP